MDTVGCVGHTVGGHSVSARARVGVGVGVGVRDASLVPQLKILNMALSIVRFPATRSKRDSTIGPGPANANVPWSVASEQVIGVSSARAGSALTAKIDTHAANLNDFLMSFHSPVREGDVVVVAVAELQLLLRDVGIVPLRRRRRQRMGIYTPGNRP